MEAAGAEHPVLHAVVILNWNGRAWLERFLGAVEATTPEASQRKPPVGSH